MIHVPDLWVKTLAGGREDWYPVLFIDGDKLGRYLHFIGPFGHADQRTFSTVSQDELRISKEKPDEPRR